MISRLNGFHIPVNWIWIILKLTWSRILEKWRKQKKIENLFGFLVFCVSRLWTKLSPKFQGLTLSTKSKVSIYFLSTLLLINVPTFVRIVDWPNVKRFKWREWLAEIVIGQSVINYPGVCPKQTPHCPSFAVTMSDESIWCHVQIFRSVMALGQISALNNVNGVPTCRGRGNVL